MGLTPERPAASVPREQYERVLADLRKAEDWGDKLLAERDRYREALERIAAPKRPDGTYNLSREACEQIAKEALRRA